MAIGILIFEQYCRERTLHTASISALSDHLWMWPLIDGPDKFAPWVETRLELIDFSFGHAADEALQRQLDLANIDTGTFREIVYSLLYIIWGSFWGAAEDEQSMSALETLVRLTRVQQRPPLTPFKFSTFSQGDGWGNPVSAEDLDFWRRLYRCT